MRFPFPRESSRALVRCTGKSKRAAWESHKYARLPLHLPAGSRCYLFNQVWQLLKGRRCTRFLTKHMQMRSNTPKMRECRSKIRHDVRQNGASFSSSHAFLQDGAARHTDAQADKATLFRRAQVVRVLQGTRLIWRAQRSSDLIQDWAAKAREAQSMHALLGFPESRSSRTSTRTKRTAPMTTTS